MPILDVPAFGGGLHFEANPRNLQPDQWSWSDGWMTRQGTAETACAYVAKGTPVPTIVAGGSVVGIVPYLANGGFGSNGIVINSPIITVQVVSPSGNAALYGNVGGPLTPFTLASGGAPTIYPVSGRWYPTTAVVTLPDMTTRQLVTFGKTTVANAAYATLQDTGTAASYVATGPTTNLTGAGNLTGGPFTIAVGGHFLAGYSTTVGVCDVNADGSATGLPAKSWDPDISNSADEITLDSWGQIQGAASFMDSGYFLRRATVYRCTSTGGIPPFTFQLQSHRGSDYQGMMYIGATPAGIVFDGTDNFYLNDQPLNPAIYRYWQIQQQRTRVIGSNFPRFLWHPLYGTAVFGGCGGIDPASATSYGYTAQPGECLYLTVADGTWWRRSLLPAVPPTVNDTVWDHTVTPGVTNVPGTHIYLTAAGQYYQEDNRWFAGLQGAGVQPALPLPFAGGFVDTKDFCFGEPPFRSDVSMLKVDWEPLSNATTDTITILAYTRDEFSPSILGALSMNTNYAPNFVTQGTLTGGQSELHVRLRGKYHRFRFQQTSGMARIRGFSITYSPTGDDQRPR